MGLHTKSNAEKIGFWLTLICGIHCIATPLLLTFLPILGSKFEIFHKYEHAFLFSSLILAIYLMCKDYKIHENKVPIILIVIAATINIINIIFLDKTYEIFVSVSIAALIITAYWLNWKHKEKCHCEHVH